MLESVSLSAPVTIQLRKYIDPTIGGAASPSILTVIIGPRHVENSRATIVLLVIRSS